MSETTSMEAPASVLTEVKALNVPDMAIMNKGATSALRMAQSFVISNEDDYQLAGEELQSVKIRLKKMEGSRTAITGPMNKALDAINDLFRGPIATLKSAESAIKTSMLSYYDDQQRKAAEARRLAEVAAAAERARLAEEARQIEAAAAAERKRIADEAAAVAAAAVAEQERLAKVAEDAAAEGNKAAVEEAERQAKASRQQAELHAQQAEQRDMEAAYQANDSAAALQATLAVANAQVTSASAPKAAGISTKAVVEFEVTNLLSLVQHIAANPTLINLVMQDNVKLRAYVRGLGLNTNLPGVHVYEKRSMSSRAA